MVCCTTRSEVYCSSHDSVHDVTPGYIMLLSMDSIGMYTVMNIVHLVIHLYAVPAQYLLPSQYHTVRPALL